MSIASELSRLQQAKSDLATSIASKGVTVPAATTLDGYAALVDQIQQGGGTLPYDAEIEYLQGDGAAYILTSFTPSNTTRIVIKVKDYEEGGRWIFGTRTAFTNRAFGFYGDNSTTSYASQFGSNYVVIGNYNLTNSGIVTVDYNGVIKTCTITSDYGSTLSKGIGNATFTAPAPLVLFGLNFNGSSVGSFSEVKLYAASIYSNGSMVHDFIPVRVGQVGYLYDKVSKTLLGNSGTGDFILGADKN